MMHICIILILSFTIPPKDKSIDNLIYNQENRFKNVGPLTKTILLILHRVEIASWIHTVDCLHTEPTCSNQHSNLRNPT